MSIMKVILGKIIHFLCYGTPNMASRWLLWSPSIKELYLIHYSPLKHKKYKKSNSRTATGDIWMLILLFGWWVAILDLPKMGLWCVAKLNPVILSQFCPYRYIHPNWIWGFKSRQHHLGDMPTSTSDCTHTMSCKWPESGHWAICN